MARKRRVKKRKGKKIRGVRRAKGVSARLRALERLLKNKRPKSKLETLCIQRQMSDLETAHRRGLAWDEDEARRNVDFFGLLKHWKGEWAGKKITLGDWQEHCLIAPLFGWRREDGTRRFRIAYFEMPRKQGKTTIAAGLTLQGAIADEEAGAEVYTAATKRDQALICFNDAKKCMGPELRRVTKQFAWSITCPDLDSFIKPLSSDHDSMDGLNTHRAIIDELHAHKTRGLWDVLDTSTGARRQPLLVAITTAGVDRQSICWEQRKLAVAVLEGKPDHRDSLFTFIACAEDADDWQDPETWKKANPNFGISVKPEKLDEACFAARASAAAENNFRRKHLNQWVGSESRWIDSTEWAACRLAPFPSLEKREMFGAIDLGWRDDFAAVGLVAPERVSIAAVAEQSAADDVMEAAGKEPLATVRSRITRAWVDGHVWVPEEGRRSIDEAPLCNWIRQGLVTVTPGNTTDWRAILSYLLQAAERYELREVALDPNNARQAGVELVSAGIPTFEFWQTARNYNEPSLDFAALVAGKLLHHDGNDLLSWMIGNVVMRADPRGYVMPRKDKSLEKIDLPVALLMAYARAMFTEVPSFYWESHPLEVG
jgi:phage terminase large subunit-like protein